MAAFASLAAFERWPFFEVPQRGHYPGSTVISTGSRTVYFIEPKILH